MGDVVFMNDSCVFTAPVVGLRGVMDDMTAWYNDTRAVKPMVKAPVWEYTGLAKEHRGGTPIAVLVKPDGMFVCGAGDERTLVTSWLSGVSRPLAKLTSSISCVSLHGYLLRGPTTNPIIDVIAVGYPAQNARQDFGLVTNDADIRGVVAPYFGESINILPTLTEYSIVVSTEGGGVIPTFNPVTPIRRSIVGVPYVAKHGRSIVSKASLLAFAGFVSTGRILSTA